MALFLPGNFPPRAPAKTAIKNVSSKQARARNKPDINGGQKLQTSKTEVFARLSNYQRVRCFQAVTFMTARIIITEERKSWRRNDHEVVLNREVRSYRVAGRVSSLRVYGNFDEYLYRGNVTLEIADIRELKSLEAIDFAFH